MQVTADVVVIRKYVIITSFYHNSKPSEPSVKRHYNDAVRLWSCVVLVLQRYSDIYSNVLILTSMQQYLQRFPHT